MINFIQALCVCIPILILGYWYASPYVAHNKHQKPSSPIPDLRFSEYAPDLDEVNNQAAISYHAEKHQLEYRLQEAKKLEWEEYHRKVELARIQRWKEGNPVTKQSPLLKEEMPSLPYRGYF